MLESVEIIIETIIEIIIEIVIIENIMEIIIEIILDIITDIFIEIIIEAIIEIIIDTLKNLFNYFLHSQDNIVVREPPARGTLTDFSSWLLEPQGKPGWATNV